MDNPGSSKADLRCAVEGAGTPRTRHLIRPVMARTMAPALESKGKSWCC